MSVYLHIFLGRRPYLNNLCLFIFTDPLVEDYTSIINFSLPTAYSRYYEGYFTVTMPAESEYPEDHNDQNAEGQALRLDPDIATAIRYRERQMVQVAANQIENPQLQG